MREVFETHSVADLETGPGNFRSALDAIIASVDLDCDTWFMITAPQHSKSDVEFEFIYWHIVGKLNAGLRVATVGFWFHPTDEKLQRYYGIEKKYSTLRCPSDSRNVKHACRRTAKKICGTLDYVTLRFSLVNGRLEYKDFLAPSDHDTRVGTAKAMKQANANNSNLRLLFKDYYLM
jgi:hypothetical protein